jgi:hypothetical protein
MLIFIPLMLVSIHFLIKDALAFIQKQEEQIADELQDQIDL